MDKHSQTRRDEYRLAHADRRVNAQFDETGLTDRQLNRIVRDVLGGTYPISPSVRKEVLERTLKIIRNSESPRDFNAAVRNLLAMDKHNQTIAAAQEKFASSISVSEHRRQALEDDELLAELRRQALEEDDSKHRLEDKSGIADTMDDD